MIEMKDKIENKIVSCTIRPHNSRFYPHIHEWRVRRDKKAAWEGFGFQVWEGLAYTNILIDVLLS